MTALLRNGPRWWSLAALLLVLLWPVGMANAQSIRVQPVSVEADVPSGQPIQIPFRLLTEDGFPAQSVEIRLAHLFQGPGGSFAHALPTEGEDAPQRSLLPWMSAPESVALSPDAASAFDVTLTIPRNAFGTYSAALLVRVPPPQGEEGLRVAFVFRVPIVLTVRGRPGRTALRFEGLTMVYDDGIDPLGEANVEPTTRVGLRVLNAGTTSVSLEGMLRVERQVGEDWRLVTRADLAARPALPGTDFDVAADLGRRLPSGRYQLTAAMTIDGRAARRLVEVIDFEGDPSIDEVTYDTTLQLDPVEIEIPIVPGATRTTVLSVANPSDRPIAVRMAAVTPGGLEGVAIGGLVGTELSAQPWTTVAPDTFTLPPLGRRNVRVLSRIPREGLAHREYFAELVLGGQYPDGAAAGETRAMMTFIQDSVAAVPTARIVRTAVSDGEANGSVVLLAGYANVGNVTLKPEARFGILGADGQTLLSGTLEGQSGALLPFATRDFSTEADLSGLEPGTYVLAVSMIAGQNEVTARLPFEITETQGTRTVRALAP